MQKLTAGQQATLKKHKKHHSSKHMSAMTRAMREDGVSFSKAHKLAQKKVGA